MPLLRQLIKAWFPTFCVAIQIAECIKIVDSEVRDTFDAVHNFDDAVLELGEFVFAGVLAHVNRLHLCRVCQKLGYLGVNEVLRVRKVHHA